MIQPISSAHTPLPSSPEEELWKVTEPLITPQTSDLSVPTPAAPDSHPSLKAMYPFWSQPPTVGSQRAPPCLRYLPFTWQPGGEHVRDRGGISIHRDTTSSLHLSSLPSLPGCAERRHPGSLSQSDACAYVCCSDLALPLLRAEICWC